MKIDLQNDYGSVVASIDPGNLTPVIGGYDVAMLHAKLAQLENKLSELTEKYEVACTYLEQVICHWELASVAINDELQDDETAEDAESFMEKLTHREWVNLNVFNEEEC